ncbi:MAG TPA: HD domain-containing phosphohydrolase [Nitrospiraceae bacterium]|jgi:putative nucleotidyltransferase with HDIG domain
MPVTRTKPAILIVEDEEGPRNALKIILRPFYELSITSNRHEALQALLTQPIDLVTLDLKLPDGYGLDLFHSIKRARRGVEIVIITGYGTLKSSQEAVQHGAAGYLLKPFNVTELITLINRALEKKNRLDGIRDFLRAVQGLWQDDSGAARAWAQFRERFPATVSPYPAQPTLDPREAGTLSLLADLMEASDRLLLSHANRVRGYSALLAAPLKLSPADKQALATGSFLHDLGRVAMERWESPAQESLVGADTTDTLHPMLGVRMAAQAGVPERALQIIAHHHERHDGSGYPDGLAGDHIPLLARIVGIAQTFDHLTTPSELHAMPFTDACAHLGNQAGTALDPDLVELFLERLSDQQPTRPAQTSA